jgi:hypothetical protein
VDDDVMELVIGPLAGVALCGLGGGWPAALGAVGLWGGFHAWVQWRIREQHRREVRELLAYEQLVRAKWARWRAEALAA